MKDVTAEAIEKAKEVLSEVIADNIMNSDFDLDWFINDLINWEELQGIALAYGKKLEYKEEK